MNGLNIFYIIGFLFAFFLFGSLVGFVIKICYVDDNKILDSYFDFKIILFALITGILISATVTCICIITSITKIKEINLLPTYQSLYIRHENNLFQFIPETSEKVEPVLELGSNKRSDIYWKVTEKMDISNIIIDKETYTIYVPFDETIPYKCVVNQ